MENDKCKLIAIDSHGDKLEQELHYELGEEEVQRAFDIVLRFFTFTPETIVNYYKRFYEDEITINDEIVDKVETHFALKKTMHYKDFEKILYDCKKL